MAKTEGTYIQVAYKNVCGYISTNSWPFFMIQRPPIREKCAWVRYNTWRDERPVFFGFSIFRQTLQLATEKIQNLCNRNRWSGLLRLGSVRFLSFFQSSELDLWTLWLIVSRQWVTEVDGLHNLLRWIPWNRGWTSYFFKMDSMEWDGLHTFLRWNPWSGGLFHKSRLKFIWHRFI